MSTAEAEKILHDSSIANTDPRKVQAQKLILEETTRLQAMIQLAQSQQNEDAVDEAVDEIKITLNKTAKGYGMTLATDGDGVFVGAIKPGGGAEPVLRDLNLTTDDGLRFKSIGGRMFTILPRKNVSKL